MEERFNKLAVQLLEINPCLTYKQARNWVEGLWEDFEATRARAGWEYGGKNMTEQMVVRWIQSYGAKLHEYVTDNPKYQRFMDQ